MSFREDPSRIPEEVLKQEYKHLPLAKTAALEILAERDLVRLQILWDELKYVLLRTKGKIGYKITGHIVSVNTIRQYPKAQDGFYMRRDHILPVLECKSKETRVFVVCSHIFWMHLCNLYTTISDSISKHR